jgi:uncharacterized membrane protein YeaQ/YmgE (transglycosylase-associated protein family)
MSMVVWLALGLVIGLVANRIAGDDEGFARDAVLGVTGAIGGGLLSLVGWAQPAGLDPWSLPLVLSGSVALVATFHAARHARLGDDRR